MVLGSGGEGWPVFGLGGFAWNAPAMNDPLPPPPADGGAMGGVKSLPRCGFDKERAVSLMSTFNYGCAANYVRSRLQEFTGEPVPDEFLEDLGRWILRRWPKPPELVEVAAGLSVCDMEQLADLAACCETVTSKRLADHMRNSIEELRIEVKEKRVIQLQVPTGRRVKRVELIQANRHEWPSIENDLKNSGVNGLSKAAKAEGHGWWDENQAREWARSRGKLTAETVRQVMRLLRG